MLELFVCTIQINGVAVIRVNIHAVVTQVSLELLFFVIGHLNLNEYHLIMTIVISNHCHCSFNVHQIIILDPWLMSKYKLLISILTHCIQSRVPYQLFLFMFSHFVKVTNTKNWYAIAAISYTSCLIAQQ